MMTVIVMVSWRMVEENRCEVSWEHLSLYCQQPLLCCTCTKEAKQNGKWNMTGNIPQFQSLQLILGKRDFLCLKKVFLCKLLFLYTPNKPTMESCKSE